MRKADVDNNNMPDLLSQLGYEPRDVSLRGIFIGIGSLFVFIFVAMGVSIALYNLFIPDWYKSSTRMPMSAERRLPPHPQIQVEPKRDMALYRAAEDELVAGKIQDGHGHTAKISIEDAMNKVATERGIAGIRGDAPAVRGNSYPGSTGLTTGTSPASNAPNADHDMAPAGGTPSSEPTHGNGAH